MQFALRLAATLAGVAAITFIGYRVVPVNATTIGFALLLFVLIIASTWGFVEAVAASIAATFAINFFYLPPIGTLTIYDPQNWVALFSFLSTSLIASRLSDTAKRRTSDALDRQRDVERLYTFSRSILLLDSVDPIAGQLARKLSETFELPGVALYDRHTGNIAHAGPSEIEDVSAQLRDAALRGSSFTDPARRRSITAIRLGADPIASLALEGALMQDSVLQGIANLVAIGLERARSQELTHQMEAARRNEQLRTTIIDAMAHEFKTPLTSIKAATTSLLASPDQPLASRTELLTIADEEAEHLRELIDDSVEMARLDSAEIAVHPEMADPVELVRAVAASMRTEIEDGRLQIQAAPALQPVAVDRKLMKLAIKQIVDNAVKYSPPRSPVEIRVSQDDASVLIDTVDRGPGIPPLEQNRIFDRFYRSPSVRNRVTGTGLGLSIAVSIVRAHGGELTVESKPGETVFRIALPREAGAAE